MKLKIRLIKSLLKKSYFNDNEVEILNSLKKKKSFIIEELTSIVEWNEYIIDEKLNYILEKLDLKFKQLGQPLRLIISGNINGPSVSKLMEILGKEHSLERLNQTW